MDSIPIVKNEDALFYDQKLRQGEARLLHLHINSEDEQIVCDLSVKMFSDVPKYNALSYVWGGTRKTHKIIVNSQQAAVTESLYDALCSLRSILMKEGWSVAKPLWVDAICINQTDKQERSEQVLVMGRIYGEAWKVFIFLGRPTPPFKNTLRELLDSLYRLYNDSLSARTWWEKYYDVATHVLSLPWFSRVWVMQEAVLAKQPIVIYGDHADFFQNLFTIFEFYDKNPFSVNEPTHNMERFNRLVLPLSFLVQRLAKRDTPNEDLTLAFAMSEGRSRKCTDSRDHVYGMIGLIATIDGAAAALTPHYSKTVAEVYSAATRYCLENTQEMGLNYLVTHHREPGIQRESTTDIPDLPSWVPNLSTEVNCTFFVDGFYTAGGDRKSWAEASMFENDDKWLTLNGFKLGSLGATMSVEKFSGLVDGLSRVVDSDAEQDFPFIRITYGTASKTLSACRRALCADVASSYRRLNPALGAANELHLRRWDWCSENFEGQFFGEDASSDWNSHEWIPRFCMLPDDAFFVFSTGRIGMGRGSALVDDILVVFPGISMPFLLRPRLDSSRYQMIGPTFVHGIMDGEAMKGLEEGTYQMQSFVID